jgi:glycine cleavage system H protein
VAFGGTSHLELGGGYSAFGLRISFGIRISDFGFLRPFLPNRLFLDPPQQGNYCAASMRTVLYKRATFITHLPVEHWYTPSHSWMSRIEDGQWRVGYTKFALRMLGELVDVRFDLRPEAPLQVGEVVGTIEGFKAISDIYSAGQGRFVTGNPGLASHLEHIGEKPYDEGWLYQIAGEPDSRALDVDGYRALLDVTIDRILEKQRQDEDSQ